MTAFHHSSRSTQRPCAARYFTKAAMATAAIALLLNANASRRLNEPEGRAPVTEKAAVLQVEGPPRRSLTGSR